MIALWLERHGKPGEDALASFVRFQNSTSLRFPSCEVEAIVPGCEVALEAAPLRAALGDGSLKYVHLVPSFLGLLGGAGALPLHYTERVVAHAVTLKDHGPRAFLDMFSQRTLVMFYEGWRKYRLELKSRQRGRAGFLPLLLALAGVGNSALRERLGDGAGGGILDESLGHFAAALRQRPASAVQIARVLSAYFEAPIRIEQFVGSWYAVPEAQQTRLGVQHCVLGGGALAGAQVWQRDLRMRVIIGPLDHAAFNGFLPGGAKARSLRELLAMFTGVTLEYEVQLVLRGADVLGVTLGGTLGDTPGAPLGGPLGATGARLGWDTFLAPPAGGADRGDVRYELMVV